MMMNTMRISNNVQKPINPRKYTSTYRRSKIMMNTSKCPDSKNFEEMYDQTIRKFSQPAIDPIVEQMKLMNDRMETVNEKLKSLDEKLNQIMYTLEKTKPSVYPYDDIFIEGIRETNDVY